MKVINFFKMNDWPISKFLTIVFVIQISLLGIIGLEFIGLKIPVLRELIAFIYLTFIPGILILRIFRLHDLSTIESIVYSVGLSISTLMFLGFFVDIFYPLLGILKPISLQYLLFTITGFVLLLAVLSYIIDKDFSSIDFIDLNGPIFNQFLFLLLIPFLAILGTYLMNFYNINTLLLIVIILVSIIFLLVSYNKFDKKLHTFALFIISITLLYQGWLISTYIWGTDIYSEYAFSKMVIDYGYWNWNLNQNTDAMLSITMLGPIYYFISNLNLTWIYKIIYPFLFSLVPLGMYHIIKKQTTVRIAFLTSFFFVSTTFFSVWVIPFKQELAELYIILLTLILINEKIDKRKASFLLMLFGFSLIVSHYGTAYFYLFFILFAWISLLSVPYLLNKFTKSNFINKNIAFRFPKTDQKINATLVALFIVFALAWYIYISSSSLIESIVNIGQNISTNIYSEFLSPTTVQGLSYITSAPKSIYGYIQQFLYLSTSFLIVIGVLSQLIVRFRMKFDSRYYAFSFAALIILFASITLPYFSSAIYTQRLYQLSLVFLAPFCVVGGILIFRVICSILNIKITKTNINKFLNIFSIFLVIFLLFNIGFVDEVAGTHRLEAVSFSHEVNTDINVYEQDISASNWLNKHYNGLVYSDLMSRNVLMSYGGFNLNRLLYIDRNITLGANGEYMYFGYQNIFNNMLLSTTFNYYNMSEVNPSLDNSDEIYSSGGTKIIIFKK